MSIAARSLQCSAIQAEILSGALENPASESLFLASLASWPIKLSAEVLAVKRVPSDSGVSYGHTYRTKSATTLALVSIGYGHGLPRKAGNRAEVTWGEPATRLPIVGRVAMDVLVVDAGDSLLVAGGRVAFFGDANRGEIALREWAESVGETPLSLVASLDARVPIEVVA